MRATGSSRSSTAPASPAPSSPRSAPTPASPPSASGAAVERRGLVAFIPPQPTMLPRSGEPTSEAQRAAVAARARCKSKRGVWAHKQRMADAEGVIGELKNQHALDRVRSRGTPLFHVQLLLGCAALNCKRLADHVPQGRRTASPAHRAPLRAASTRRPQADPADQPMRGPTPEAITNALLRLTGQLELHSLSQLTPERPPHGRSWTGP